ncbi:preprotein translocase subunit YajC [Kineosporia rhizophila]|uniref:preprotein translocase subunit YajC n=1 Tax=Kineosporia TaxID=49184 RepID=UPI000A638013|nr:MULTISPECIES: preprotein translocase subunit YajC [Kineosporia]MCE0539934.1 preprotein translocase subunit YajC [Kineosporia rhizophila]GLY17352.1 preprotein translocase subunit YajC [Kineosporia sp. NBRC 101677]
MELIILAVPLVLLWLMVSRGRKQQRELMALQDSVTPGTRVMTTSGLYAEVVEIDGEAVVLEIAPGVHTRWTRRAIAQVVTVTADDPAAGTENSQNIQNVQSTEDAPVVDVRSEAGHAAPPSDADDTPGTSGR